MAKQLLIHVVVILGLALTCIATTYTVGDNSGWDISTDLDTWAKDKKFTVGDVLSFQYSSSHSVSEVTKENYDGCKTTDVLQTSSNGNTSFPLSAPGDRYFICGNKLHCFGGMKLQAHVEQDQSASPAGAPEGDSGDNSLPNPSSKNNDPSSIPSSAMFIHGGSKGFPFVAFLGFVASLLWMV